MRALCKRFGLPLDNLHAVEPAGTTDTYFAKGSWYTNIDADFAPVRDALKIDLKAAGYPTHWDSITPGGKALDQMSVYDWISTRVPGGHNSKLGKILDVAYNIEYGAETKDQSSLNLVYLLGYQPNNNRMAIFGASDETYHVRGGNQKLPMAIASALPANTVQFGYRMTQIAQNADKTFALTFKTANGTQVVTADAVVLALPFAVLRTLDYSSAGFDARKDMAIQQLGRGQNGKLMLQFKTRLWNQAGPWGKSTGTTFSDSGYQASWEVSRAQAGNSGILVDYTGGNATVDGYASQSSPYTRGNDATTLKLGQKALTMLEPVYPGLTAQANGKTVLSIPPKDTDFNCSYSYLRVGQYTAFAGHEKAPQGHCFLPVSTAVRIIKALWKVLRLKANELPMKSLPRGPSFRACSTIS